MIQTIYIDGYKSLKNFSLQLKQGLNALVGANGAGKSNILEALDLVSKLFYTELYELPAKLGLKKVNELFSFDYKKNEISIILDGLHRIECRNLIQSQLHSDENPESIISLYTRYKYEFKIGFDRENPQPLTFLSQRLELDFDLGGIKSKDTNKLIVEYSNGLCEVKECNLKDIEKFVSPDVKSLPNFLKTNYATFATKLILPEVAAYFYPITQLIKNMSMGDIFEINPSAVRNDATNLQFSQLQIDGTGLTSTLYSLKQTNQPIYNRVIEGMKLITPDIVDIDVFYNKSQQKIEINTEIRSSFNSNVTQIFPLELISDGALKWYVLVTLMIISNKPIVIDEPENFLNPQLHSILVSFLRERLNFKESYGIITSHSQSIVDSINPNELIFVRFKEGYTEAGRVIDIDRMIDHMNEFETSLGWYFVTDSLDFFCFDEVP